MYIEEPGVSNEVIPVVASTKRKNHQYQYVMGLEKLYYFLNPYLLDLGCVHCNFLLVYPSLISILNHELMNGPSLDTLLSDVSMAGVDAL